MSNARQLRVALNKCRKCPGLDQWAGYLTPVEILLLVEKGAKLKHPLSEGPRLDHCLEQKQSGESNPTWFYFIPGGEVKVIIDKG